jgi:hypothetical protein
MYDLFQIVCQTDWYLGLERLARFILGGDIYDGFGVFLAFIVLLLFLVKILRFCWDLSISSQSIYE